MSLSDSLLVTLIGANLVLAVANTLLWVKNQWLKEELEERAVWRRRELAKWRERL
jgi:hypothetical protein